MFSSEKYGAIGFLILCIFASLVISKIFGLKEGLDNKSEQKDIDLIKKVSTPIPPIKDAISNLEQQIEAARKQVETAKDTVNNLTIEAGKAKHNIKNATENLAQADAKGKIGMANVTTAKALVTAAQK